MMATDDASRVRRELNWHCSACADVPANMPVGLGVRFSYLLLLLLFFLSFGASADQDTLRISLGIGTAVIDRDRIACNPTIREKRGFTAWGVWSLKGDIAEFRCKPKKQAEFFSIEAIKSVPFSQVILINAGRQVKKGERFDYYERRISNTDRYEIVAFIGVDGEQVVVRRSGGNKESYRAFRKLNDMIEISYVVRQHVSADEDLVENDRKILGFVKSIVRIE